MKPIESTLTSAWANDYSGEQISRMGRDRRKRVRDTVARAIKRNSSIQNLARNLKRSASVERDKNRDWQRVARTEVTDANGKASYELAVDLYGPKVRLYRLTDDCCLECRRLFGHPSRPKVWAADKVPDNARGAVHPNCKCSPWKALRQPNIVKAMSEPHGLVSRTSMKDAEGNHFYNYSISNGLGDNTDLFSVTARYLISHYLNHVPLVAFKKSADEWEMRHGYCPDHGTDFYLLDPLALNGVRCFQNNPNNASKNYSRELRMTSLKTWFEYVSIMTSLLPSVFVMPEFYRKGQVINRLEKYLGFRNTTDWVFLKSGDFDPGSILYHARKGMNARKLSMEYTKLLLENSRIRKSCSATFYI